MFMISYCNNLVCTLGQNLESIFRKKLPVIKTDINTEINLKKNYINEAISLIFLHNNDYIYEYQNFVIVDDHEIWFHYKNDKDDKISIKLLFFSISCNIKKQDVFYSKKNPCYDHLNENNIYKIDNVGYFGIRVLDIVKLCLFVDKKYKENDIYTTEDFAFINKILKVNYDCTNKDILAEGHYFNMNNDDNHDNHNTHNTHNTHCCQSNKQLYTIENFANKIVLFYGSMDIYSMFNEKINKNSYEDVLCKMMKNFASHIVMRNIINIYYFNKPYKEEIEIKVFETPRSITSIIEEYHKNSKLYYILRKYIKESDLELINENQYMIYNMVNNFTGKDVKKTPLARWNTIYFETWCDKDYYDLEEAAEKQINLKKDKNYYNYKCKCSYCMYKYSRATKKQLMRREIIDALEEYKVTN